MSENGISEDGLRRSAVASLKKKADFRTHVFVYVVVNAAFVAIWAALGAHFFWPLFPMLGWGIGLVFHARDVYARHDFTEDEIRREMERMS
jgi:2TM domain